MQYKVTLSTGGYLVVDQPARDALLSSTGLVEVREDNHVNTAHVVRIEPTR